MTRETTRCESILKVDDDVLFDPDRLQLLLGLADQQLGEETNLETGLVGQHTGESEGAVQYCRMADLQNLVSQKKHRKRQILIPFDKF